MKTVRRLIVVLSALPAFLIFVGTTPKAQTGSGDLDEEPILVGRVSHIEGQLLRHQPGDEKWSPTLNDTPFGAGESLYTEGRSRAEVILTNGTWTRLGGETQMRLLQLREDLTELIMDSGTGRFYNKSDHALIKVKTVFGDVTAPSGTEFDLHLYGNAVEIISLTGTISLWHYHTGRGFEVTAGSSPLVADVQTISVGKGHEPPGWVEWNRERDALWTSRMTTGMVSAAYLPPELRHEAYALDENGVWEPAYYDGGYYYFWRPTRVAVGWSPFTVGCWNDWYRESTWVPYEPFGYVTHHYGNWVFVGNAWYWSPPVARLRPRAAPSLLNIGFAWVPGRVAWIHFGSNVGWVPLAPHEPYHAHRRWGHKTVVVKDLHVMNLNVKVTHYQNHPHAVVIDRNDLHRARNYRELRTTAIDRTFVTRNYQVATSLRGIATTPADYARDGPNPARSISKIKASFTAAKEKDYDRWERFRGGNNQPTGLGGGSQVERVSTVRQRPQGELIGGGYRASEAVKAVGSQSSTPKQKKVVEKSPSQGPIFEPSFEKRRTPKSPNSSGPTATRFGLRQGASQVSGNVGQPSVERGFSKPSEKERGGSNRTNSPRKLKTDDGQIGAKGSFSGSKRGATDDKERQKMRHEQRHPTRITTPAQSFKAGNGPKVLSGKGGLQPSSKGSVSGSGRGFFRN